MADISNLKIGKMRNENWEVETLKLIYIEGQI